MKFKNVKKIWEGLFQWQVIIPLGYLIFACVPSVKGIFLPSSVHQISVIDALIANGDDGTDDFFAIPVKFFLFVQNYGISPGAFSLFASAIFVFLIFRNKSNINTYRIKFF